MYFKVYFLYDMIDVLLVIYNKEKLNIICINWTKFKYKYELYSPTMLCYVLGDMFENIPPVDL